MLRKWIETPVMDCVSADDLGDKLDEICKCVEASTEFVVTRDGWPFALLVPATPNDVDKQFRALRATRLDAVFERMRSQPRANGTDQLTDAEIQGEIDAVRAERRRTAGST